MVGAPWRFLEPIVGPCRVVFAGPHFQAAFSHTQNLLKERLGDTSNIELIPAPTREELFKLAPTAHIAIPFMEKFSGDFLRAATKLRLSIQFGVGLEGVDIQTSTSLGIAVSNIPADATGNAQATSELAIYLALSLLRYGPHDLRRRFENHELGGLPLPRTLYKKRVTVVGYGSLGKVLTNYLITFGADVTVVRKNNWSVCGRIANDGFAKSNSLEEALPTTDVLILACTMTPETLHLVNHDTISLLPRGALVVNVGRGPLVKYHAIWHGLQTGHVGGFASDVGVGHDEKPSEPWDPLDKLSLHPRALFTPHVGGYTDSSYDVMSNKIIDSIERVSRGEAPPEWVNQGIR